MNRSTFMIIDNSDGHSRQGACQCYKSIFISWYQYWCCITKFKRLQNLGCSCSRGVYVIDTHSDDQMACSLISMILTRRICLLPSINEIDWESGTSFTDFCLSRLVTSQTGVCISSFDFQATGITIKSTRDIIYAYSINLYLLFYLSFY